MKKINRFNIVTIITVIFSIFTIINTVNAAFSDISDSFAKNDIMDFVNKWIIQGFTDWTFRPNNPTSRAEFLAMTMKALNVSVDDTLIKTDFTDIPASWMIKYVEKAKEYNINWQTINWMMDFRPNDPISRAEAMAMLLNIAWISSSGTISSFSDVTEPWMIKYTEEAKALGIANWQTIGWMLEFRPNDPITRAEAVTIIAKTSALGSDLDIWTLFQQNNTSTINISNLTFVPSQLTINAGDTITWKNSDSVGHQIDFTVWWNEIKSNVLNLWDEFSYTFDNTWTINYTCIIHPSMKWTIIIQ